MENNEFLTYYDNLEGFAKEKLDRMVIDLTKQQIESQNYVIHVCPKCGAVDPGFKKGGHANSGKSMLRCNNCNKRFVVDHGQLTYYSHQDSAKWDQLIKDTFDQIPIEKTAATLNISTWTVWRMRMKFLHALEALTSDTVVSGEIELDEKYLLNSHKGTEIEGVKGRKRGGSAKKRGLSNEQICLPTAVQRDGTAVLLATNTATPTAGDIMKLASHIGENSMAWLDGKTAWNRLLDEKKCGRCVLKDHTEYTTIDHINNVNSFHKMIEDWYNRYRGVASKYINRYSSLFVLVREYAGCDLEEILLSIKSRLHKMTDYFFVREMEKADLFVY